MKSEDAEEFAALWTQSHSTIAAFVRSLVPNSAQAEEIVQRVSVTLIRKFEAYDRGRPFTSWAIGIAKNEVLYSRRQWATDARFVVFDDELVTQLAYGFQRLAEQTSPREEALMACVEQLSARARHAIRLRYVKDFSSDKIAEEMQLSAGAARMLLCRARKLLRECIERQLATNGVGGG